MAKAAGLTLRERDQSPVVSPAGVTDAAVVIWSTKGPFRKRTRVTNTKRFRDLFGNEAPGLYGHYSALAVLEQGPIVIVRTAKSGEYPLYGGVTIEQEWSSNPNEGLVAGITDPTTYSFGPDEAILIAGADPGRWNGNIKMLLSHDPTDPQVFKIQLYMPDSEGVYSQVGRDYLCSRVRMKKDGFGKSMYIEDVLKDNDYVAVKNNTAIDESILPKEQLVQLAFTGGSDGTAPEAADIASAWGTFFANKKEVSVRYLVAGGWYQPAVANKLSEICGNRQDCHSFLDTSDSAVAETLIDDREAWSLISPSYCHSYVPWVKDTDETNGISGMVLPSSGYACAACIRKNKNAKVYDAFFGKEWGALPVEGLVANFDDDDMELLASSQLNVIKNDPGSGGIYIMGGYTLQPYSSLRSWVNIREQLIDSEVANLAFLDQFIGKRNTPFLRLQVTAGLDSYYNPLKGEAYYDVEIVCNDDNNTPDLVALGELIVAVYEQPVPPINRITLEITVTRQGITLREIEG